MTAIAALPTRTSAGPLRLWRGLRQVPGTVVAAAVVLATVVICMVASALLVPSALDQDILLGTVPAGAAGHLLGTDALGRDVLQLTVAGARSAVMGPVVVALGSMVLGVVLGSLAGYRGGFLDTVVARSSDLVLALPPMLLAIVVAGVIGGGYWVTVGVLVVLFSPSDVRMVRAAVIQQRQQPYIEATQVLGIGTARILARHVLPNVLPVVLANLFLNVAFALVAMSSLSYLGVGVQPGAADWGRQLADGRGLLFTNPAAAVVPGLLIILTAIAINLLGDWLAERLGVEGAAA